MSSNNNNHNNNNNSSSLIEVSEIISSVDIDRDNLIVDHISGSSNEISGNFYFLMCWK
jgi:hypothetical protein